MDQLRNPSNRRIPSMMTTAWFLLLIFGLCFLIVVALCIYWCIWNSKADMNPSTTCSQIDANDVNSTNDVNVIRDVTRQSCYEMSMLRDSQNCISSNLWTICTLAITATFCALFSVGDGFSCPWRWYNKTNITGWALWQKHREWRNESCLRWVCSVIHKTAWVIISELTLIVERLRDVWIRCLVADMK